MVKPRSGQGECSHVIHGTAILSQIVSDMPVGDGRLSQGCENVSKSGLCISRVCISMYGWQFHCRHMLKDKVKRRVSNNYISD